MKKILPLCFLVASIVLMALPFGVAMTFDSSGPPDFETITRYYSYFDPFVMWASGNALPMCVAYLTIGLAIGYTIGLFMKPSESANKQGLNALLFAKTKIPAYTVLILPLIASILSWVIFSTTSVVGVIIFSLHAATLVLGILIRKNSTGEMVS